MTKKKKIIVLSCMIALLAVTAIFNFVMTSSTPATEDVTSVSNANYFTQYRTERLTTRNEEIMQLDSIIASADANDIDIANALETKLQLMKMSENELLLETLIKAYGFEDVVVVMGLDTESVNVIAKAESLTADDAIKICTIISEENIASPENVKIIPIY